MIISKPDYYDEFQCIADQCEDTCCAGWQIVIDEEALEAYKKVEGDFGERLRSSIDWEEGVFHQDGERRCAFLNDKNLCDLYTALGEASLCVTCTNYPRHIEEFENIREYTLSVSCPEVAKILLNKKEPVAFIEEEDEAEEEFEDFDFLLFSQLEDARDLMQKILQNRTLDISLRAYLVWELGREIQEYIDEENLFAIDELFEKYGNENTWHRMEQSLKEWKEKKEEVCQESQTYYSKLYELEFLKEDWNIHLMETEAILYGAGSDKYSELHEEFLSWMKKHMPDHEIWLEQLLLYFIRTYFCGAVYDGYVGAKAKMAIFSVWMIYEMLGARWMRNAGSLDMDDVILIVYRYSRELEHSDENLGTIDELLDEE